MGDTAFRDTVFKEQERDAPFAKPIIQDDYRPNAHIRVALDKTWRPCRHNIHFEVEWHGEPKDELARERYRQSVLSRGYAEAQLWLAKKRLLGWTEYEKGPDHMQVYVSPLYMRDQMKMWQEKMTQIAPDVSAANDNRAYYVRVWVVRPLDHLRKDPEVDNLGYKQGVVPVQDLPERLQEVLKS